MEYIESSDKFIGNIQKHLSVSKTNSVKERLEYERKQKDREKNKDKDIMDSYDKCFSDSSGPLTYEYLKSIKDTTCMPNNFLKCVEVLEKLNVKIYVWTEYPEESEYNPQQCYSFGGDVYKFICRKNNWVFHANMNAHVGVPGVFTLQLLYHYPSKKFYNSECHLYYKNATNERVMKLMEYDSPEEYNKKEWAFVTKIPDFLANNGYEVTAYNMDYELGPHYVIFKICKYGKVLYLKQGSTEYNAFSFDVDMNNNRYAVYSDKKKSVITTITVKSEDDFPQMVNILDKIYTQKYGYFQNDNYYNLIDLMSYNNFVTNCIQRKYIQCYNMEHGIPRNDTHHMDFVKNLWWTQFKIKFEGGIWDVPESQIDPDVEDDPESHCPKLRLTTYGCIDHEYYFRFEIQPKQCTLIVQCLIDFDTYQPPVEPISDEPPPIKIVDRRFEKPRGIVSEKDTVQEDKDDDKKDDNKDAVDDKEELDLIINPDTYSHLNRKELQALKSDRKNFKRLNFRYQGNFIDTFNKLKLIMESIYECHDMKIDKNFNLDGKTILSNKKEYVFRDKIDDMKPDLHLEPKSLKEDCE